ncbi:hypothetical protein T01_3567 [Trichinella spiralis]|uniref:Uncharacterized protein n=1 Tax=Trichinella spiralis TaxID=6334 RepID=A0A0V1BZT6_TRISP|nr:hypothetical protein T01_3567 [Trichinella spiralis]
MENNNSVLFMHDVQLIIHVSLFLLNSCGSLLLPVVLDEGKKPKLSAFVSWPHTVTSSIANNAIAEATSLKRKFSIPEIFNVGMTNKFSMLSFHEEWARMLMRFHAATVVEQKGGAASGSFAYVSTGPANR